MRRGEKEERCADDKDEDGQKEGGREGRCQSGGELSSQNMDEYWAGNGPDAERGEQKKKEKR